MMFFETPLKGAFLVEVEPRADERGLFARTFCVREFEKHGLVSRFVQENTSYNRVRGTLRGMHYQAEPHPEIKLVRCTRGRIWDVIVDLRQDSTTYLQWYGVELTAENRAALYVPAGFAHGFQTLENDSEVLYLMSEFYVPELAGGVRYNDPKLGVKWPLPASQVSERDLAFRLL